MRYGPRQLAPARTAGLSLLHLLVHAVHRPRESFVGRPEGKLSRASCCCATATLTRAPRAVYLTAVDLRNAEPRAVQINRIAASRNADRG